VQIAALFFIFCFTYVIYATFIVTTLVKEIGFSEAQASHLWIWIGFCALFSGPLFGALSDRLGRGPGMMSVFAVQTCSYLLAASQLSGFWIYLSVTLYGLSAFSIPSIIVAALSDYLPRARVTAALGTSPSLPASVRSPARVSPAASPICPAASAEVICWRQG
jgi:predicted MFS family arabinose efflux permease